jgi:hypothetical protein
MIGLMNVEQLVEWELAAETKEIRENPPCFTSAAIKSHMTGPRKLSNMEMKMINNNLMQKWRCLLCHVMKASYNQGADERFPWLA